MNPLSQLIQRYWILIQVVAAIVTIGGTIVSLALTSYAIYIALVLVTAYAVLASVALTALSRIPTSQTRSIGPKLLYCQTNEATVSIDLDHSKYAFTFVRRMKNVGDTAVTSLPWRFFTNAFPDDPAKSREYYSEHTISLEELKFRAHDETGPLDVELVMDFNAEKHLVVHLAENGVPRPIYPGQERTISRSFQIAIEDWRNYLDRDIDCPTDLVKLVIVVSASVATFQVGGYQFLPGGGRSVLRNPPSRSMAGSNQVWVWEERNPLVGSIYQFHWTPLDPTSRQSPRY